MAKAKRKDQRVSETDDDFSDFADMLRAIEKEHGTTTTIIAIIIAHSILDAVGGFLLDAAGAFTRKDHRQRSPRAPK
jgi:hypothetical protein